MGWAERANQKSAWNKKRQTKIDIPLSTQTTQKQNFQATTPVKLDEPVVIEFSLKNFWGILCRRLKTVFKSHSQDLAQNS